MNYDHPSFNFYQYKVYWVNKWNNRIWVKFMNDIVNKSINYNNIYFIVDVNYDCIYHYHISNNDNDQIKDENNNEKVDINTEEKETIKNLESYPQCQKGQ